MREHMWRYLVGVNVGVVFLLNQTVIINLSSRKVVRLTLNNQVWISIRHSMGLRHTWKYLIPSFDILVSCRLS